VIILLQILSTPRAISRDRLYLVPIRDVRVVVLEVRHAEDEVAPVTMDGIDRVAFAYNRDIVQISHFAWLPLLM
jgi:hypothetical protein